MWTKKTVLPTFPQPRLLQRRRHYHIRTFKRYISASRLPGLTVLHHNGTDEPQTRCFVREDVDYPSATADFLVEPFNHIDGPNTALVRAGEGQNRQSLGPIGFHPIGQFRGLVLIFGHILPQIGFGRGLIGCVEDGADIGGYLAAQAAFGHIGLSILLQMKLAALSGYSAEDRLASRLQTGMGI